MMESCKRLNNEVKVIDVAVVVVGHSNLGKTRPTVVPN